MAEKTPKPVSNKQFAFFGGIALSLLSAICVLNMWVVARAITLPFFFLFGLAAYLFFAYMFAQGMMLIIKKRAFKVKFSLKFVGVVLCVLCINLLLTAFYKPEYTINTFGDFIKSLNYIQEPKFLNLFQLPIAGGFIGVVLFEVLNNVAAPVPFIIGFLVLFVGLAFIFMNPILSLVTDHKNTRVKKPKKVGEKPVKDVNPTDDYHITRDNTSDVIRDASVIDDMPAPATNVAPAPAPIPLAPSDLGPSVDMGFRGNDGVFTPAHFVPGVIPGDTPSSVMGTPKPTIPGAPGPSPIPAPPTPAPVQPTPTQPVEPMRSEQLTLDFNQPAPPVIDEALVTAQPQFEEPVSTNSNPVPAPAPAPAPAPKVKIKWVPPSNDLLEVYEVSEANNANIEVADQRTVLINQILSDYGIRAEIAGYTIGPSVTRYNVKYDYNVEIKSVERKVDDIARRLGGVMCRFEPIVRGTEYSGLEIPNARVVTVSFKDVFDQLPDAKKHPTAIPFGKNIQGEVVYEDFAGFPHLLVAGTTGSGKSVFIHSIISTLIMRNSPDNLKLVLVDPKRVEMVKYRDIPHLLCPIINDPAKAKPLLDKLVDEMNERYDKLAQGDGFSDINEYNEYAEEHGLDKIPVIIAVLDEFGDLTQSCKDISRPVLLLGQKARACGIHMLIATQSPTSDIITGTIKSNLPTHVALSCSTATQSVTILGEGGAEKLLGRGDMLVQCPRVERGALTRLQGCYIANKEISRVAGYLREHYPTQYDEKFLNLEEEQPAGVDGQLFVANNGNNTPMDNAEEMKYQDIKAWVMTQQYTSMSKIQRECSVGFNRAGRFFNRLVQEGIVSPQSDGNKGCKVLVHDAGTEISDDDNVPVSDELC